MKRRILFLVVGLMLLLCACASSERVYTVERNGISYVVDEENETIFDGTHTYQYDFSGNASSYDVEITYPDGSGYWFTMSGSFGHGGFSDDYDPKRYADGDTLCEVLLEKAPRETNPGKVFGALLVAAVGIFNIAAPYSAWYLEYGWRYKNAQPSDLALGVNRVVGVIVVIVAVVLLFA